MDFDDIFEMLGIDPDDLEDEPEPPDFRATIRPGQLTVISWAPHLLTDGPQGHLVRERAQAGVSVADIWVVEGGPTEVIVRYLAVADRRSSDKRLARWAESVGHSRIWFPDRLLELDGDLPLGAAYVECTVCGAQWRDRSPEFWSNVRKAGRFPSQCPICNGDLPQWRWRPGSRVSHGKH